MADILNFSTANEDVAPEVISQGLPSVAPPPPPQYGNINPTPNAEKQKDDTESRLFAFLDNVEAIVDAKMGESPVKSFSQQEVYKFNNSTNPITRALFGDYVSRYNKYLPGADNETLNAQEQSGWSVAANAFGGMLFNAGEAFSGYIAANGRAIDAAKNGDWSKMWDTEFTENQAKDLATASDFFAIYKDAANSEGLSSYIPFLAGSGEKWGHLAQSFGFTIGTLGGVAAENALFVYTTGGVGNLLRGSKTLKGVFDAVRMLSFADKGADALKGLSMAQKLAANGLRYGKNANVALNAAFSEGSMEAAMASLESMNESIARYKELYGVEPDEAEIQKIKEQREKVGNTTFSLNAPILLASNFAMFGNYMRTGKFFSQPISELSTRAVSDGVRAELKKGIATNAWRASKKIAGVVPEGLEGVSQSIASESAKRHYDLYSSDTGKSFLDTMVVTTGDLYKSGRMAEDFLSGAIIGGISMGIGAINDHFRGNKDNIEDRLNQYNTTFSENIRNAIEGIGERRMPEQIFGVAGTQTANKLQAGMEGMNAMAGQIVAKTNKDKKEFYDHHSEANKNIAYANWSNGMSQIGKELTNATIDAIPANEYAAQYMTGQPTDEQIAEHKEKKKAEFAKMQDEFDATMDTVEERYGNPFDKTKNPELHQSWEEVKRDIAFYKQDYRDAISRSASLNESISKGINKFYEETGVKIEQKDIDLLVSQQARMGEIQKIEAEEKALNTQLSALDGTIHSEQQKDIREKLDNLAKRKDSISKLSIITMASATMDRNDNDIKKAYQLGVDEWLRESTGMEFGAENPLMEDISDMLVLEAEGRFLLSLHNALMSNGKLVRQYHYRYTKAGREAKEKGLQELREKHRQENGIEPPSDKEKKSIEDEFSTEEINAMKKALGVENLYEVEKDDIQKAIDKLDAESNAENVDLVRNLEKLKSQAYAPNPVIANEEQQAEIEEQKAALNREKEALDKAREIEQNKEQPTSTTQSEIEAKKADIERRRQEELTNLKVGDSYDVISSTGSYDGTWKVVEITDKFYRLTDNKGGKLNMGKPRVEENLKRPDGVTETKYRKTNIKEINAKYDAELKELEESTSTTQSEIEAKKADIERRRQEELTNLKVGDSYDVISSTGSYDGTWKVVEITDKFYRLTDNKGGKLNMGKPRVEENLKRPDGVTETKYRKTNIKEINAKYDAELKELEESTSTTQSEIEAKKADIEIGKVGNTEYEVKVDGVYYQGKKLNNPENKTHRQLIEADIERRIQEELNEYSGQRRTKEEVYEGVGIEDDQENRYTFYTNADGSRTLQYDTKINGKWERVNTERISKDNTLDNETYIEKAIANNRTAKKVSENNNIKSVYDDKINAKYDAELAALEQSLPTQEVKAEQPTVLGKEVEAKKADIERRRQEELSKFLGEAGSSQEFWNTAFKYNTYAEFKEAAINKFGNSQNVLLQLGPRYKIAKDKLESQYNNINAKYDAELKALKNNTPTSETEQGVSANVEAKKADIDRINFLLSKEYKDFGWMSKQEKNDYLELQNSSKDKEDREKAYLKLRELYNKKVDKNFIDKVEKVHWVNNIESLISLLENGKTIPFEISTEGYFNESLKSGWGKGVGVKLKGDTLLASNEDLRSDNKYGSIEDKNFRKYSYGDATSMILNESSFLTHESLEFEVGGKKHQGHNEFLLKNSEIEAIVIDETNSKLTNEFRLEVENLSNRLGIPIIINAKYDAELKALGQQSTTTLKKADIERRRQEELNSLDDNWNNTGTIFTEKTFIGKDGKTYTIKETVWTNGSKVRIQVLDSNGKVVGEAFFDKNEDGLYSAYDFFTDIQKVGIGNAIYDFVQSNFGDIKPSGARSKDGKGFWENNKQKQIDKINAKYDAELKALEESKDIALQNEQKSQVSDVENLTSEEFADSVGVDGDAKDIAKRWSIEYGKSPSGNIVYNGEIKGLELDPSNFKRSEFEGQENSVKRIGAENIDLSEPIKATIFSDGTIQVQDGHHRLIAAQELGKKLKVDLTFKNTKPESVSSNIELVKAVEQSLKEQSIENIITKPFSLKEVNIGDEITYEGEKYSVTSKNKEGNLNLQLIGGKMIASDITLEEIENWKKNENLASQKVSQYGNILSPSEMKIARKLLSRAFPNIIEMTDDEVFKAMNGLKLPIGMMLNGKMWVNSERETLETRMHELGGHVFFLAMKNQYPSLYERLMGQLTDSIQSKSDKDLNEVVKFVKELYPELAENSSQFNEEVMATYMGQTMRDGVAKAIKSKGIKSDIAYWLNYIYERLMNLLGIDNYMSMDKFANNTLGENLVHIGKGLLSGRVRSDISTDELATIMSASPTYMKGITNELEELKKAIDILPVIEKRGVKEKIVVRENKSIEDWDKEIKSNFSFLSLYDMGVKVDEIMVSAKDYDKDNHIVKTLADLSGDKPDPRDIVQVFYSNGTRNILTMEEERELANRGIAIFDLGEKQSYLRGRIFFYRTSQSDVPIKKVLEDVAKLSFSNKRGIHKLSKDGKEIMSTSDLAQKANKEALLKVKSGDEIAVSMDFDNEWNQGLLERVMKGEKLGVKDYETVVLTYKNQKGEILSYMRALNGAFDNDKKEKNNEAKNRIETLRKYANETLEATVRDKKLVTARMQSLQRELSLPSTTEERKASIQKLIDEAYEKSSPKDFIPLDLFSIPAIGTQAIYNENLDEWMPISEFLEKRKALGDEDFQLAFFKKNKNGEWKYFDKNDNELDIYVDGFERKQAVYLVSPNYQRRAYFNVKEDMWQYSDFEEFQSLDPSIVSTRLNPETPYLDVRLKVDLGISPQINRTTSSLEETALNENNEISQEQEDKGNDVEKNRQIIDDVKTSSDDVMTDAPQSKVELTQQDEEFIYDMIPLYYGLEPNSDMYRAQGIMVEEMNDGLLSKGLKLTEAVGDMPKEYFSRVLEDYKRLKTGQINLKSFIFNIVKQKKSMDNQILIEGDGLIAPKAPEGAKIIRIDEVNVNRLALLFDAQNIYIHHKNTYFWYEFPKKNFSIPIEKQVKNAIRLVMMANGEKASNFDAFYQEYTRNNIDLSVDPQQATNLVRVTTSPYSVYKFAKSENIANDIKC